MKFLLHANAPHTSTGYGVQCRLLVERLVADGHDVAVSCTFGQQGGIGTWRGVTLYPQGFEPLGNDVLPLHALHHFGGDPKGGWIITLLDVGWLRNPALAEFNMAVWTPVDHDPVPPAVLGVFDRFPCAVPVAMSQFGADELGRMKLYPDYIPLAVDTQVFQPTASVATDQGPVPARAYFEIPRDKFAVGMVAMNKGWHRDRKGFNEAFRGFGRFHRDHPDSVLVVHSERFGAADGMDLPVLAKHAGIPDDALIWTDQYAYRIGQPAEAMAALYSAFDVLLAPSHGEGFCLPLVEAQACGTPVVASDFSAQKELVGVGVKVSGQLEWDPTQASSYIVPAIGQIAAALGEVYDLRGDDTVAKACVEFAAAYDADLVYDEHWRPFLASLEPRPAVGIRSPREPIAADGSNVAVVVPAMRPENLPRLLDSLVATAPDCEVMVVADRDFDWSGLSHEQLADPSLYPIDTERKSTTYAEKVNAAVGDAVKPWLLLVGDDVEFHPGWIEAAVPLSDRFDVIGTNDSLPGRVRNPIVASGEHADHFFVRRAYVDEVGSSLDGPGILAPECYFHWLVDLEIVGLAKARGVFSPCLDSIVEHHHPGYDGREDLREADPVYMAAVEHGPEDLAMYERRSARYRQGRRAS